MHHSTETEMSSFWLNFHHWLHWKLSKWQLPVQPMIKISSKWQHFRFSVWLNKLKQKISCSNVNSLSWHWKGCIRLEMKYNSFNSLRPRQNRHYSADDIFKCIFLNENIWISVKISLKFVPMATINNILALVQIMAWRRPGDKPLSEPMAVRLLTYICVTSPQCVKWPFVLSEVKPGQAFLRQQELPWRKQIRPRPSGFELN